jgi:hypothetical protein
MRLRRLCGPRKHGARAAEFTYQEMADLLAYLNAAK